MILDVTAARACLACRVRLPPGRSTETRRVALRPRIAERLCDDCLCSVWPPAGENRCIRCSIRLPQFIRTCDRCSRSPLLVKSAYAPFRHDGVAAAIVRAYKFGQDRSLARPMSELMRRWMEEDDRSHLFGAGRIVVPVPSSRSAVRRRGFHSARLLANELCAGSGMKLRWLLAQRGSTAQKTLSVDERQVHACESLYILQSRIRVVPERVLLVDDVLTTGATVSQAAVLLAEIGVKEVDALVFAMEY